jgi:hypothetical protein
MDDGGQRSEGRKIIPVKFATLVSFGEFNRTGKVRRLENQKEDRFPLA